MATCALVTFVDPATIWAEEATPSDAEQLRAYDEFVRDSDRDHWSFRPVERPALPGVKRTEWIRNPIDRFVLAKLESRGWFPAPPAERRQLMRRMYFDLIGLPPTPEEQDTFLAEPLPEAADRLIDDLLANPRYGERWGRHWLDLVRYAESNGYERDGAKPHVWRYRDYVVRAFNEDKSFDRFAVEQLAGDELPDSTGDTLIATGYYRLGPWDDEPADPKEDRFDQLDDMVGTTSQVFLGLTLGCARCHNHKFEPLSTLDYYRMVAIFNPLQRPQAGRTDLDSPAGSRAELATQRQRDDRIAVLAKEAQTLHDEFRNRFLDSGKSQLSPDAIEACRKSPRERTEAQKKLVEQYGATLDAELAAAIPDAIQRRVSSCEAEQRQLRDATPDLPRGYFLVERSAVAPATFVLKRGRATAPGAEALPGLPKVLVGRQPEFSAPAPGQSTSGRRLALARWITSEENPLTARVIVNRVWQFHFGEGIVRTSSDFGVMGSAPTHPELLDWLADWFVNDGDWSIKKLHRLIMTSNAYRMSKRWRDDCSAEDPADDFLWRFPYRRLEVEAICDAMLSASGKLNPPMYGPSMYPFIPRQAIEGNSDPSTTWKPFDEADASRRTIYSFVKRSLVVPLLEVLDLCDTTKSAAQRSVTSVAPQALTMLNGDFVNRQARHFAARLEREAGQDRARQIERAYRLALGRGPTATETESLIRFLERETTQQLRETAGAPNPLNDEEARKAALVQMCRVIFNLNEFVYTD